MDRVSEFTETRRRHINPRPFYAPSSAARSLARPGRGRSLSALQPHPLPHAGSLFRLRRMIGSFCIARRSRRLSNNAVHAGNNAHRLVYCPLSGRERARVDRHEASRNRVCLGTEASTSCRERSIFSLSLSLAHSLNDRPRFTLARPTPATRLASSKIKRHVSRVRDPIERLYIALYLRDRNSPRVANLLSTRLAFER